MARFVTKLAKNSGILLLLRITPGFPLGPIVLVVVVLAWILSAVEFGWLVILVRIGLRVGFAGYDRLGWCFLVLVFEEDFRIQQLFIQFLKGDGRMSCSNGSRDLAVFWAESFEYGHDEFSVGYWNSNSG